MVEKRYGVQSEVGRIGSILLKRPQEAFISQDDVDSQWESLNYSVCPDYQAAVSEYERFVALLKAEVPDVHFLPQHKQTGLDSLYVRDAVCMTANGAILCNMGKAARRGEPDAAGEYLGQMGVPILGAITGQGRLEGGDIVWLDRRLLVVGRGYRTNDEGIRQLAELTSGFVDELLVVPLVHWKGPDDVFHLMSFISPVDRDLAVVYSRLMPVPFRERIIRRGITLIDVPDEEYPTMACNVLAIAPRKCLMLAGNPRTRRLLEDAGAEVHTYEGREISRKGAGGPTCLTRPLSRSG